MSDGVKVFVGNLPDRCPESSLEDLFSPYGKIKGIIMVKTYAFVHFESDRDARKAVEDLHKTKLLGKELTVEIAKNKPAPNKRGGGGGGGQFIEKRSRNTGLSNAPPANITGGILGMGPGGPGNLPNAALGLLSAVNAVNTVKNAVAAASGQDHQRDPSRDRPPPSDGYVIYERFYVDRSHPLLKGLPVPELPRVQDVLANRDGFNKDPYAQDVSIRDDPYVNSSHNRNDDFSSFPQRREEPNNKRDDYFSSARRDDYNNSAENFRERSPLYNRREYDNRGRGGYDDHYERR